MIRVVEILMVRVWSKWIWWVWSKYWLRPHPSNPFRWVWSKYVVAAFSAERISFNQVIVSWCLVLASPCREDKMFFTYFKQVFGVHSFSLARSFGEKWSFRTFWKLCTGCGGRPIPVRFSGNVDKYLWSSVRSLSFKRNTDWSGDSSTALDRRQQLLPFENWCRFTRCSRDERIIADERVAIFWLCKDWKKTR